MSCHGCSTEFGFLKREKGCPKCGFAYCSNCLRFKSENKDVNKGLKICKTCFEKEINSSSSSDSRKILQKLRSLDEPPKPPIVVYRDTPRESLKRGLSKEDQEILIRLENLKKDLGGNFKRRSSTEMDPAKEIEARLAKLKDQEVPSIDNKPNIMAVQKPETEVDLIERLTSQVKLDHSYNINVVSDIEERLAKLKSSNSKVAKIEEEENKELNTPSASQPENQMEFNENMTDEEAAQLILNKYIAEVELEKKNPPSKIPNLDDEIAEEDFKIDHSESDEEEDLDIDLLCRICEEKRAIVKCKQCDGDKFCKACFREFHIELGETDHKPTNI